MLKRNNCQESDSPREKDRAVYPKSILLLIASRAQKFSMNFARGFEMLSLIDRISS